MKIRYLLLLLLASLVALEVTAQPHGEGKAEEDVESVDASPEERPRTVDEDEHEDDDNEDEDEDDEDEDEVQEEEAPNGGPNIAVRGVEENPNANRDPNTNPAGSADVNTRLFLSVCVELDSCRRQNGWCRSEACNRWEDEVPSGCRGYYCRCCIKKKETVCLTDYRCGDQGGTCKTQCRSDEWAKSGCSGKDCYCCVPTKPVCVTEPGCLGKDGICRTDCAPGEIHIPHASLCKTGCKCCSKQPECTTNKECRQWHSGECKRRCSFNEKEISDVCSDKGCICCQPQDDAKCVWDFKCKNAGGKCREGSCNAGEWLQKSGCYGGNCVCCIQEKCKNEWCSGTCKEQCGKDEEEVSGGCSGKCWCCSKKKDKSCVREKKCKDRGGQCRERCLGGEKGIPGGCWSRDKNKECWCCVPKKCKNNRRCDKFNGNCSDKATCDKAWNKVLVKDACFGVKGKNCECCAKDVCVITGRCARHGGICREDRCKSHEVSDRYKSCISPGKKNCKCCVPSHKLADLMMDNEFVDEDDSV